MGFDFSKLESLDGVESALSATELSQVDKCKLASIWMNEPGLLTYEPDLTIIGQRIGGPVFAVLTRDGGFKYKDLSDVSMDDIRDHGKYRFAVTFD